MQIGACWFNAQEQVLVDSQSGRRWQLSSDEFKILSLLSNQRGKVVSRMELLQQFPSGISSPFSGDEFLDNHIRQLRNFLGKEAVHLLDTVADQGFILYATPRSASRERLSSPVVKISMPRFIILTLILLASLFWMGSRISHPSTIAPDYARQLLMSNGEFAEMHFYTGERQDHLMRPLVEHFSNQISTCEVFPWQSIAATLSEDKKLVTLVLKKSEPTGLKVKSIKLMSANFNAELISHPWLKMVGICG